MPNLAKSMCSPGEIAEHLSLLIANCGMKAADGPRMKWRILHCPISHSVCCNRGRNTSAMRTLLSWPDTAKSQSWPLPLPAQTPELGAFKAIFGLSHRPSFEWRTISYDVTSKTGLSLIGFEVLVLLPVRHELRGETSSNLIDFHHRSMVHAFLHDFPLLCRASEAWFLRGKPQCQGSNGFLWIQETILERQFGSFCVYIWIIVCVYIIYIYI